MLKIVQYQDFTRRPRVIKLCLKFGQTNNTKSHKARLLSQHTRVQHICVKATISHQPKDCLHSESKIPYENWYYHALKQQSATNYECGKDETSVARLFDTPVNYTG